VYECHFHADSLSQVGGSDLAYRLLCRRFGAQVTYTEMCIASTYFNPAMRREDVFEFDASDRPLLLQLTDCVPEPIIELAKDARFVGCIDAIDLNLGCPQPFAMKRPVGAGLVCGAFS
jgi:tRNA-dihydrouridine synthase